MGQGQGARAKRRARRGTCGEAAGCTVEAYWPMLMAKARDGRINTLTKIMMCLGRLDACLRFGSMGMKIRYYVQISEGVWPVQASVCGLPLPPQSPPKAMRVSTLEALPAPLFSTAVPSIIFALDLNIRNGVDRFEVRSTTAK